jgi:hypothetical protein
MYLVQNQWYNFCTCNNILRNTFYKYEDYFHNEKALSSTTEEVSGMNKCTDDWICFNDAGIAISHRYKAHIKLRN